MTGGQWYGGPGRVSRPAVPNGPPRCVVPPTEWAPVGCGAACGPTAEHRWAGMVMASDARRAHRRPMPVFIHSRAVRTVGSLVGASLFGLACVAIGVAMAYLTIGSPMVTRLAPLRGASAPGVALGIWAFALVAGVALIVAGTNQLAAVVAGVRGGRSGRTPVARAAGRLPEDTILATDVVPLDGRPIPELVIGPFGVAVFHELPPAGSLRRMGHRWEANTSNGWRPAEDPLDHLARDAERVRRWLGHGDLDFVTRVYAVLVAPDLTIARSPTCAVITEDQIVDWLLVLPRQRSLTAGRRSRILTMAQAGPGSSGPKGSGPGSGSAIGW